MPTDQERRLEEILGAAPNLPPLGRAAFLGQACGGEAELRSRAESLLAAHAISRWFLQPTVVLPTRSALVEKPVGRIGRCRLLKQTGDGGFGVVGKTDQEEPVRRRVALKIIKLGCDILWRRQRSINDGAGWEISNG